MAKYVLIISDTEEEATNKVIMEAGPYDDDSPDPEDVPSDQRTPAMIAYLALARAINKEANA